MRRLLLGLESLPHPRPRLAYSKCHPQSQSHTDSRSNRRVPADSIGGITQQVTVRLSEVVLEVLLCELRQFATAVTPEGGDGVGVV